MSRRHRRGINVKGASNGTCGDTLPTNNDMGYEQPIPIFHWTGKFTRINSGIIMIDIQVTAQLVVGVKKP